MHISWLSLYAILSIGAFKIALDFFVTQVSIYNGTQTVCASTKLQCFAFWHLDLFVINV